MREAMLKQWRHGRSGAWCHDAGVRGGQETFSNYVQYAVVNAMPGVARHYQIARGRGEEDHDEVVDAWTS